MGITRVGISSDSVANAADMTAQHKFSMTLLSDADLAVTDLYNIRNKDGKTPIPTTLFITPDGIVRWIDVSPDYRKRNEGKVVLAAVKEALAAYKPAADTNAAAAPAASPTGGTGDYSVVLQGAGEAKILVVKELRAVTGLGLADCRDLIDATPVAIQSGLTWERAKRLAKHFATIGASVQVQPIAALPVPAAA